MSTLHIGARAIRGRRATARINPGFAALLAAMLAVFGGCYAIGRATAADGPQAAPFALQAASQSVASPIRLSGMPAIAIPTIPKAVPRLAQPAPRAPLLAAPVQPLQPALSPAPQPATSPLPARAPSPSSNGSAGSEGGHARPSNSAGGSFDSSG